MEPHQPKTEARCIPLADFPICCLFYCYDTYQNRIEPSRPVAVAKGTTKINGFPFESQTRLAATMSSEERWIRRMQWMEPKGCFITMHMKNQAYAEIEPKFNEEFFDELGTMWALLDEIGNIHQVDYNRSLKAPVINNGWEELRTFYKMTGDHMVFFGYMGHDLFKIRVFQKPSEPASIPPFHSCCPRIDRPSFTHTLSPFNITASHLDLHQQLATHVRNTGYESLLLIGPTGAKTQCKVLVRDGNKRSTKLGKGWKTFSREQGLKSSDVLNFAFVNPGINEVVKVEKLSD